MQKQYLITERAHFMCPNMHFGMLEEIEKDFVHEEVESIIDRMAEAHPFLKSLIAYEDGTEKLYYKVTNQSQIQLIIREDRETLWEDYALLSKEDWNVFENGMLKVYVYPKQNGMSKMLIKQANAQWRKEKHKVSYEAYKLIRKSRLNK
ncbi:MAG: hypothetical protein J6F30_15475 [Cellulosilyticum sp.]|nr:hypothetical protein [Cellulosilyticum sp.]